MLRETGSPEMFGSILTVENVLKEHQVFETRSFPRIGYALVTAKTQVKIYFVHYLKFN